MEKARQKAEKRAARKEDRGERTTVGGVDPDIVGIVPGPQPVPLGDRGPVDGTREARARGGERGRGQGEGRRPPRKPQSEPRLDA